MTEPTLVRRVWLRRSARLAWGGSWLLMAGCQSWTAPPLELPLTRSGRLAIQVEGDSARSFSASFDLYGNPDLGALSLTSPLGSVIGRAEWNPRGARLVTPEGRRHYRSVDELSDDLLGEQVPLLALFDWMEGRPSSISLGPVVALADGSGFRQSGWDVDNRRASDGRISARRHQPEPPVTLRLVLDPR